VADRATRARFEPPPASTAPSPPPLRARPDQPRMPFVDVNAFSPPLVFTRADVDETVDKYAASLRDVFGV